MPIPILQGGLMEISPCRRQKLREFEALVNVDMGIGYDYGPKIRIAAANGDIGIALFQNFVFRNG